MEKILIALACYTKFTPQERCQYLKVKGFIGDLPIEWNNRISLTPAKVKMFENYYKTFSFKLFHLQLSKNQIHYVTLVDKKFPKLLTHIYSPPLILFYKGNLNLLDYTVLGVVGSRRATSYGLNACQSLIATLVQNKITIASGLARGIDTKAHTLSIGSKGATIAVIGTGIDVYYPKENRSLQDLIGKDHLLLSEYPPGTDPRKEHFPYRNRIISGISRGVLVVESQKRSGSLITARQALEEGRDVFSVPGSIFNSYSAGCNDLIKAGAIPVHTADDILKEWEF